jgi:hypothetical protein
MAGDTGTSVTSFRRNTPGLAASQGLLAQIIEQVGLVSSALADALAAAAAAAASQIAAAASAATASAAAAAAAAEAAAAHISALAAEASAAAAAAAAASVTPMQIIDGLTLDSAFPAQLRFASPLEVVNLVDGGLAEVRTLPRRELAQATLAVTAIDTPVQTTLFLGRSGVIYKVSSNIQAWIRVYGHEDDIAADAARLVSEDPAPTTRIQFEAILMSPLETRTLMPVPYCEQIGTGTTLPYGYLWLVVVPQESTVTAPQITFEYVRHEVFDF